MENCNYALVSADEKGTVLAMRGHVDSDNSKAVEGGMMTLRAAHPSGTLSIDASVLDSISGTGLNMLMRLRRNEDSLRLFNVNNEVYNALERRGLTRHITVEKSGIVQ